MLVCIMEGGSKSKTGQRWKINCQQREDDEEVAIPTSEEKERKCGKSKCVGFITVKWTNDMLAKEGKYSTQQSGFYYDETLG